MDKLTSNKIIAYDNFDDLKKINVEDNESLIITAYKDTAKTILDKFPSVNILSIGEITDEIFEFWNNKEIKYENITNIREFIKDNPNKNIVKKFNKCVSDIYSSIRIAKELNISLEEYKQCITTDEEELFFQVMKEMFLEDNFIEYDIKLFNYNNNIEFFKQDFEKSLEKILKDKYINVKGTIKNIYLQGFYYITPFQYEFIYWLSKLGYNIHFIICCNPKNDEVNSIIRKTFDDKEFEYIGSLKDDNYIADVFSKILDGEISNEPKDIIDLQKINFKLYDDINTYNKELINFNNKIYAVNRNELIERLSIFEGEVINSQKILIKFQPIGMFLKEIYSLWDSKKKQIIMNMDSLCRIFETEIINEKSKKLLEDLKLISNYFIDCETMKDWLERIEELKVNIINCEFQDIKRFYGPFSVNVKNLDEIAQLLNEIKVITDNIFYDDEYNRKMEIHLSNLEQIIEENTYIEENNFIVIELLRKIQEIISFRSNNIKVNNNHLYEAITFYLNSLENEDEDEVNVEIFSLDSIEGINLSECNEIFVSDFDRNSFPSSKTLESMFLNKKTLEKIKDNKMENEVISRQLLILENKDLIGKYVFWLLLKSPVKKTLARLVDSEKNNEHFYEVILKKNGVLVDISTSKNIETTNMKVIDKNKYRLDKNRDFEKLNISKYCPLRGYYYRINNNTEQYTDDFAIEHFLANLFSLILYKDSKVYNKKILNELCDLIPQYSTIRKNTIRGSINNNRKEIKWNYNEFWIPKNYKLDENFKKFKEKIMKKNNINEHEVLNFILKEVPPLPNDSKNSCMYCPNRDKCTEVYVNK